MTTWSDLTTALKRLLQTLLKVIKGRISFKWMGEQESDTPLSSNERVPLGIQMKNANFRHAYYKNLTMNTEIQAEYILLNAHFKRLVNSIAKNNSGLEMLSLMPKALLCQVLYCIWKKILLYFKRQRYLKSQCTRSIQIVCI